MKIKRVKLKQVRVNKHNHRTITAKKMEQLIVSLLVLPSMLEMRQIVVDNKMVTLGGNMRLNALNSISKMSMMDIRRLLEANKDYLKKSKGERDALLSHWEGWLSDPTVSIIMADSLSDEEKKQFMITDNASFGQWDFDALANEWDNEDLKNWGLDVWQPEPSGFQSTTSAETTQAVSQPSGVDIATIDENDLPPELQGKDLSPENLPKIEGSDETAMERIIIVYPRDRKEELCEILGLENIDKIVYNMTEIAGEQ